VFAGRSVFLANKVATINGTSNIKFPEVLYNEGNDYDSSTGVYTCRIPGTYWFSASLGKLSGYNNNINCYVLVNDIYKILLMFILNDDNKNLFYTVSGSFGVHLNKGDRVQVGSCRHPENIFGDYRTHFSGVLIRPDA